MNLPEYTTIENGYIIGTWFCGRPTEKYYGSFPKSFWRRAKVVLGDKNMLHWFCGNVTNEEGITTVDGNLEVKANYHIIGTELPFAEDTFDSSFADPPYSPKDSKRYALPYPTSNRILKELARVTKPGGKIGLLHKFLPVIKGSSARLIGCIGILNGPLKHIRGFYIFEKED